MEPLITAEELAKILNCSKFFVYKHYKKLGGIKIGSLVRFRKDFIKEAIYGNLQNENRMEIRLPEERPPVHQDRIQDQRKSQSLGSQSQRKDKADKYGLYRTLRNAVRRDKAQPD